MPFKIPLFDINFDKEEVNAVVETIESKWISMGPKCIELENTFSETLNVKHALTLTNCTASLHLALAALGITENDEVIVPSLTFVATVNAVLYVGATPVFADIKSHTDLTIDPDIIEKLITPRTKAIIPMHFAGFPANMDRIMELAKKHNLKVIEDTAHAPLSEYKGKKLGTIGDIGCFSFFSNKNISTGEGGMLVTNDDLIAQKVKLMRSHGMTTMSYQRASGHATVYDVLDLGYNYRMDDIRASIGISQFKKLQKDLEKRILIRKFYLECLTESPDIEIPFYDNEYFVSNYIFPIVLKDSNESKRDFVRSYLHENGIQTSIHYPAVHRFTIYKKYANSILNNTEYVTDNEITLPMYSSMTREDVEFICQSLEKALKK